MIGFNGYINNTIQTLYTFLVVYYIIDSFLTNNVPYSPDSS